MFASELLGREAELDRIQQVIQRAPDSGSALLLRGEAGIGKSALLERSVSMAQAENMQVLRVWGVESEAELAFAGLHQLLRPVISGLVELPAPQRSALECAFGRTDGEPPDRFYIALAALELLSVAGPVRRSSSRWKTFTGSITRLPMCSRLSHAESSQSRSS